MKNFLLSVLVLFSAILHAQTYCLTITFASSTPTTRTYNYTLTASEAVDASVFVEGTNNLTGFAVIGGPNSASMSGSFVLDITGVGSNYSYTVSDALPFGVITAATGAPVTEICGALPVSLIEFLATPKEQEVQLHWTVSLQRQIRHYEVEGSGDGRNFKKLGQLTATQTQAEQAFYAFTDQKPLSGPNYYRLRIVDQDGSFSYSPIRMVTFGAGNTVQILPNPTKGAVEVMFTAATEGSTTVNVLDMSGRLLQTRTIERQRGSNNVSIDLGGLAQGVYWIALLDETGTKSYRVVRAD